ncbi:hypothetical protein T11_7097 [Trichinella zimbabwensis]|uniref:Uncharacterized protein n=1 Tax=Trichinella zimbabwensis TaxID=268475 RepID=A0A0V1HUF2_9BILA|nr:hypothetical protein T11_7097 [Trichinella zimbabwensis]
MISSAFPPLLPLTLEYSGRHQLAEQSDSLSSVMHSCQKYWNKADKVPVVPASSRITPFQLTDFPMYLLAEVEITAVYHVFRK